jgi:enoyl-CoA hydratase/carnithine racemase
MGTYDDISIERDAGIATIWMDRPAVYNAFTREMVLELNAAMRECEADEDVYVVVLSGRGKGFCAGADTTAMAEWDTMTAEEYGALLWLIQQFVWRVRQMRTPTIAAVNGPAVGAGCDFALACELRVMGSTGYLREGFVNIGLVPGDGGGWLLPRLIGESKAKEYLLTGRDIDPEEAVAIGLAVETQDDAHAGAVALATEIRDKPATGVRLTNDLIDPQQSFDEYCRIAAEHQWACVTDPEHQEAVAAFNEKRDPAYDRSYE